MQSLDVLLFFVLRRHELHIGLAHCRANRRGIIAIIFLVFYERLHILRRDNTDPVSEPFKLALPVERARAGFDADNQRRQACQFIQKLITAQTPAEDQLARLIRSMKLEHSLGKINSHEFNRHLILLSDLATFLIKIALRSERRPSH